MGKDKAIEFLGIHPEFEAFMVYSDENGNFKTWTSERLKSFLSSPQDIQ
jgi:cytochrome c2